MPHASSATRDPWDIEHEQFLQHNPNAIVHSDRIYTGAVHKGFDADATAEELIRRYPAFEEMEEYRKFLVRSISERLALPGERQDYFTPQQLWEEDDRITGKSYFLERDVEIGSDEESVSDETPGRFANGELSYQPVLLKAVPKGVIGEEQLESDEQLALFFSDPVPDRSDLEESPEDLFSNQSHEGVSMTDDDLESSFGEESEQSTITSTTPEAEVMYVATVVEPSSGSNPPFTLRTSNHTTSIARKSSSNEEDDIVISVRGKLSEEEHIRALKECIARTEEKLARLREAAKIRRTRCKKLSGKRVRRILRRDEVGVLEVQ